MKNFPKMYTTKIFLIILVSNLCNSYLDNSKTIFNLNLRLNYTNNKLNLFVNSTKELKTSSGEYNIKSSYEINYNPFLLRPKRENNCELKKNQVSSEKQNPFARGDESTTTAISINKRNLENKNTTTLVSVETLQYLRQENETKENNGNVSLATRKSSGEVKFLDVPPGGGMKVPGLNLDGGYTVFTYISYVVGLLQTGDFPTGIFKEWLWNRLTFLQLITQALRVSGGLAAILVLGFLLGLALPAAVLSHVSCKCYCLLKTSDTHDVPVPANGRNTGRAKLIFLLLLLHILLVAIPVCFVGMFMSNEHLAQSVQKSSEVSRAIMDDLTTFVRNTHLQVRFVATTAVDQAVDAAVADLEDVKTLLGTPLQRSLTLETGIDVAMDALSDICSSSADIAIEVRTLRAEAQAARDAAKGAQERLKELRRQVDQARRQCAQEDRIVCEMVDTGGLEVIFSVNKLLSERKLSRLRHLGEDNLTSAAGDARQTYLGIPVRVDRDTALIRQEIKTILRKQREILYTSAEALEDISRDYTSSINVANDHVMQVVQAVSNVEQWRWLAGLISSLIIVTIWSLLCLAVFLSDFNSDRSLPLFVISLCLICTMSLVLWTVAAAGILLGGNGEIIVCKPLYDELKFKTMGELLDNPGMIFKEGGLFSNILKGNNSMDIPVRHLLNECRLNQPIFPTFQMRRIFNVDSLTNHLTWPKLHSHLSNLTININDTQILKPTLQKFLQDLSSASRVNITSYRQQMSGSITSSDLNAFADQLERIAGQMKDLATSARMETLAARARKLVGNNLQRLEKHRDEIVFKLATLEIHLLPLQRQANQSLSHLKTIQYYFNSQGQNISQKKTSEYVTRVVKHLERFREHVLHQLTYEVAPCRPLWDAYDATRMQLCKHGVEPMNAFWVSTVLCLILFMFVTPIIMFLIDYYKYMTDNGYLSRRELNELLLADQGPWTIPHTPESISTPEQQWSTPRRTSEQYLIPPPRPSPEPPLMTLEPGPSFRRLIESHALPRAKSQDENLGMAEPGPWRTHSMPSPKGYL